MKRTLPFVIALATLAACSSLTLSPAEQSYLNNIRYQPLAFAVAKDQATAVWERALQWVRAYSTMPIKDVTETTIVTTMPQSGGQYGYKIRREDAGEKVEFSVECLHRIGEIDFSTRDNAVQNSRILANYLQTGELPHPDLIRQ
jgi:hypothetical protein